MKLDILKTIQKYEFIYFVQLGQGSVNLTRGYLNFVSQIIAEHWTKSKRVLNC